MFPDTRVLSENVFSLFEVTFSRAYYVFVLILNGKYWNILRLIYNNFIFDCICSNICNLYLVKFITVISINVSLDYFSNFTNIFVYLEKYTMFPPIYRQIPLHKLMKLNSIMHIHKCLLQIVHIPIDNCFLSIFLL